MDKKLQEAYFATNYKSYEELQEVTLLSFARNVAIIMAAMEAYDRLSKEESRACIKLIGSKKYTCRIKFIDAKIKTLQKALSGCKKTKNPEKCEKITKEQIIKLTKRKEKYKINLKAITN